MAPPEQDSGRAREERPAEGGGDGGWPPAFPHREIDALAARLEQGGPGDRTDAFTLLALVAKEAQRLRATTVRLSAAKLAEADREAREILARAHGHADALRSEGLAALNDRLDEAERLLSALRESFVAERRAVDLARWSAGSWTDAWPGEPEEDTPR